jgi:HAMP domain-containing protein
MLYRNDRCIRHFIAQKGDPSKIIGGRMMREEVNPLGKSVKTMESEQEYRIKLLTDEGM